MSIETIYTILYLFGLAFVAAMAFLAGWWMHKFKTSFQDKRETDNIIKTLDGGPR